jgi:hypothetical protein
MNKEEIVNTLKAQYPREVRKQLVKAILDVEKTNDELAMKKQYKILNQIFSYVLHESNWDMAKNSETWDNTPLGVMTQTFPKLVTSKWYKEQHISVSTNIEVQSKKK